MTRKERLTVKVTEAEDRYIPKDGCADLKALLDRLGEYEDTGLSPAEISELLRAVWSATIKADAAVSAHLWKLREILVPISQKISRLQLFKKEEARGKDATTRCRIPWEAD